MAEPESELEIRVLGDLSILLDGKPIDLPQSRKTRALLVYLLLNPGSHRRERLCEIFWQVPDDPRGSLRWSLSKLRSLVDEASAKRLQADRNQVELLQDRVKVDLLQIRTVLQGEAQSLDTGQLKDMARHMAGGCLEGLDLSGQPLFDQYLLVEREGVRQLRGELLSQLVARLQQDPAQCVPWLQQWLEIAPYELTVHERLLRALSMAGLETEAQRQLGASVAQLTPMQPGQEQRLRQALQQRAPSADPTPVERDASPLQDIRFCRTADGVQLAYASVGEGPPLLKTANWLNHLEYDWESPVWNHIFQGFADGRQLIRYDARGNGLSDWEVPGFDFESQVSDLEVVVEASGLERFPLLGFSQGCAVSIEYAARHPERVTKLILFGGYARGWRSLPPEQVEQGEAMVLLVRTGWAQDNEAFRQLFATAFMPDAPAENHAWFNELQRLTTSPDNAADLMLALGKVDVSERLAQVQAPSLVIHCKNDISAPLDGGRELAAGIPDAKFVMLDSANHLLPQQDPAWGKMLREINAFLAD